jgi:uncharacterized protein DUF4242
MARELHRRDTRQAYLVEHYLPGRHLEQLRRSAARVRSIVGEMEAAGAPIAYIRSTIVPSDEAFLCVIEAASEELVADAYSRAGIAFDRISAAITPEDERSNAP